MAERYVKKPVTIEAVQYDGDLNEIVEFAGFANTEFDQDEHKLYIKTLEGDMLVSRGDYVIKGIQGEFYPCKPDIFEASYNPENQEPEPTAMLPGVAAVIQGKDRESFIAECNKVIRVIEEQNGKAKVQYKPLMVQTDSKAFVHHTAMIEAVDNDA